MLIYWLLVAVPLVLSLGEKPERETRFYRVVQAILFIVLLVLMGFRDTCGDFERYEYMYDALKSESLAKNLAVTESLYGLLNWVSAQLTWDIYGVNTFCALIFLACLFYAANKEPLPFFFLALSLPYFVIVVGMGYTRQGVAAGLILVAIQSLRFGKPWHFTLQIMLAAGFHASAFAALPAVLFGDIHYRNSGTKFLIRTLVIGLGMFGFYSVFQQRYEQYIVHYVESDRYVSSGAVLRSVVTAGAGLIFYLKRREWQRIFGDRKGLHLFAIASLAVVPLALVASTPADRAGLYLIPFQLIVFGRLPCFARNRLQLRNIQAAVIACYLVYFYTWLHLGEFAQVLWVPYESALW